MNKLPGLVILRKLLQHYSILEQEIHVFIDDHLAIAHIIVITPSRQLMPEPKHSLDHVNIGLIGNYAGT